MYFKHLPEKVKQGIIFLNQDEVFRERFRHDPVLDELDEEDLDLEECKSHLEQVFSGSLTVNGRKYKPMTVGLWSWLWCNSSPFVRDIENVEVDDLDFFFYYLEHGAEEEGDYKGYCVKAEIPVDDIQEVIKRVITDAFYPLKMMPPTNVTVTGKQEIIYDLAWVVSIVSAVHRLTGASQREIMHSMPMNLCMCYYVQAAKENGVKRNRQKKLSRDRPRERQEVMSAYRREASRAEGDH